MLTNQPTTRNLRNSETRGKLRLRTHWPVSGECLVTREIKSRLGILLRSQPCGFLDRRMFHLMRGNLLSGEFYLSFLDQFTWTWDSCVRPCCLVKHLASEKNCQVGLSFPRRNEPFPVLKWLTWCLIDEISDTLFSKLGVALVAQELLDITVVSAVIVLSSSDRVICMLITFAAIPYIPQ